MPPNREESLDKIQRDHDYMLRLIERILGSATKPTSSKAARTASPPGATSAMATSNN